MEIFMGKRFRTSGFTLIELMIVLAVVGVLVALAFPSYQQSVIKSDRSDGRNALGEVQLAQERYRAANPGEPEYLETIGEAVFPSALAASGTSARVSERGWYTVRVRDANRGGYLLVAIAQGKQASDRVAECARMALLVSLGGTKRGHILGDDSETPEVEGTFTESTECW